MDRREPLDLAIDEWLCTLLLARPDDPDPVPPVFLLSYLPTMIADCLPRRDQLRLWQYWYHRHARAARRARRN